MRVETAEARATTQSGGWRRLIPPLWLFAALTGVLLVLSAGSNTLDVDSYHCYALAFWSGAHATVALPLGSCLVPPSALAAAPFHTLPVEYGPLALLAFLPPLALPMGWYNTGFFIEMALVVGGLGLLLERYGAPWAGYLWIIYVMLGDIVPAVGRFDTLPAACVVIALIVARRGKLTWAYAALAVGTLFKLYPIALIPLFLIASWRARDREPFWRGPVLYAALVGLGEGLAALIARGNVMAPITFMSARCVQVESLPATLGFVWAHVTGAAVTFPYAFNSTCEQTSSIAGAQVAALILALIGIAATLAFYWSRRLTLGAAALLIVAALILGSKVFSPQYLLWLSPLVALEYGLDGAAVLGWGAVCLVTTLCFPLSYIGSTEAVVNQPPEVMVPVTAGIRNLIMLILGAATLWRARKALQLTETAQGGNAP
jgi:hypothetical protein